MPHRDEHETDRELRRLRKDIDKLERHLESVSRQSSAQSKGIQMLANHIAALDRKISEVVKTTSRNE